tara:strand:+ start:453 stop:1571 length:1119 start_codon:yes stop_codon:yes gene_type:complete
MPNFKPKANKKIKVDKKSTITLDSKHNEKMLEFHNIKEKILPELISKKKFLKKELKETDNIVEKLAIKDKIKEIKKKIFNLKKKKSDYFLENSNIIFDYFEKKKKVSEGIDMDKKKVLHSFFNPNKSINTKVTDETNINKYLINLDDNYLNINNYTINYEICDKCSGEWIQVDHKGLVICNGCGIQKHFLVEHEKPSYKEPPKEVCFYAYKRINHFREILAQFQAKETTQIPDEVITDIKEQIKKERITLKHMTNKKAKDILKKLGYNKYYEHIPFIKDKLGIKPPIMSPELEDKLCNLFMEIQKPYAKHCPDDRVNFLNYYYVLYKMCELLDEHTFLPFFPMLKDPIKRIEQDEIWKKICKELNWEFVPTI